MRKMNKKILCVAAIAVIIFFSESCSKPQAKIPAEVLPRPRMVELLVEFHLAQAQAQLKASVDNLDQLKSAYYRFIFDKHSLDYPDCKRSFEFYSSHPDLFYSVYDEVITELSKKQAEAAKK